MLNGGGRVGGSGQTKQSSGGKYEFDNIVRTKEAKGYMGTKTISVVNSSSGVSYSKTALAETAKCDILGDNATGTTKESQMLIKLVKRLSEINRHQIMAASAGNIIINDSGLITATLGMVTNSTIDEARVLLNKMGKFVTKKDFTSSVYIDSLEQYVRLIPLNKIYSNRLKKLYYSTCIK